MTSSGRTRGSRSKAVRSSFDSSSTIDKRNKLTRRFHWSRMHMWMWFGYDLGEFLFPGLDINTRWSFALTWIVLFFVALLFEASKVYLARVQRDAQKKLYPYRSDERRNLLCEREHGMEATTSRNGQAQVSGWNALKLRILVNTHQSAVFVVHNAVGYLLMLAVMVYNVHLLLAVVFGMMLGYFLFGSKLTRLQMKCFRSKPNIICTPECDDTAETSTPPLLEGSMSSESDFVICQTRTCIQPSHYFPANSRDGAANTCYYGAKKCPSRVARAKRLQEQPGPSLCKSAETEKEDGPSVEDVQLLRTEKQGCCSKKQESPTPSKENCSKSSHVETNVVIHEPQAKGCCSKKKIEHSSSEEELPDIKMREDSPQISCCHNTKSISTESQEQIIQ